MLCRWSRASAAPIKDQAFVADSRAQRGQHRRSGDRLTAFMESNDFFFSPPGEAECQSDGNQIVSLLSISVFCPISQKDTIADVTWFSSSRLAHGVRHSVPCLHADDLLF